MKFILPLLSAAAAQEVWSSEAEMDTYMSTTLSATAAYIKELSFSASYLGVTTNTLSIYATSAATSYIEIKWDDVATA